MATLSEAAKRFIVQALACYDRPTQICKDVKEEFGIDITRNHVARYDPSKASGKDVPRKWRDLFEETRKRFLEETASIPIATRSFRLRTLQRVAGTAEQMKNLNLLLQTLEQAAKEVGDVWVNRRLDPAKPPGQEGPSVPPEEYTVTLKPDEDVPDKPIL